MRVLSFRHAATDDDREDRLLLRNHPNAHLRVLFPAIFRTLADEVPGIAGIVMRGLRSSVNPEPGLQHWRP